MKFTAFILSFYFLLISAQPVLAATAKLAMNCKSECGNAPVQRECTKNDPSSCPQDKNSCPLCCINVFQCTFCCGALVEENTYKISLHPRSAVVFPGADLNLHSSYFSDCWQPPEMS